MVPVTKAITPFTLPGEASRESRLVNRSIPPVASSSAIRTVTPLTMTITLHGTRLKATVSSAARSTSSSVTAAKALNPRLSLKTRTPTIHARIMVAVRRWRPDSGGGASPPRAAGSVDGSWCLSRAPPKRKYPAVATSRCAAKLASHTFPS